MLGNTGFKAICDRCHPHDTNICPNIGIGLNDHPHKMTKNEAYTIPVGVIRLDDKGIHNFSIHACGVHHADNSYRVTNFLYDNSMVRTQDLDQTVLNTWIALVKDKLWFFRTDRSTDPHGQILKQHYLQDNDRDPDGEREVKMCAGGTDPIHNFVKMGEDEDDSTPPGWYAEGIDVKGGGGKKFCIRTWYLDPDVKKHIQLTYDDEIKLTAATTFLIQSLDIVLKKYETIVDDHKRAIENMRRHEAYSLSASADRSCRRCGKIRQLRRSIRL